MQISNKYIVTIIAAYIVKSIINKFSAENSLKYLEYIRADDWIIDEIIITFSNLIVFLGSKKIINKPKNNVPVIAPPMFLNQAILVVSALVKYTKLYGKNKKYIPYINEKIDKNKMLSLIIY